MSKHPVHQPSAPPARLLENYAAGAGVFDELKEGPVKTREHWRPLVDSLEQLGPQELRSRRESGRRIIHEHGVTYNMYGDPQGMNRPWGLDLVPFLISGSEWAHIEAGLIQRARLFNLILADIYGGKQRLLRDGFIPPELIYANPDFVRPCRGIQARANVYLHLHASDLGRSTDGQWWVLSDKTQAPSGAGYAWENRTVVSRVLPEPIRDCHVERLSHFFQRQREMLLDLAPADCHRPSIVLLTPGPHNETYFEHAFLARHLGIPLVEGADLTVRERRVFLKTIEGLQPVDVILRRVDDSFCDPLELRGDSFLGVSGLVEATRAGRVTIANALGAGLMESPAFLAFLPGLCRHLLGEDLVLPSIATWWCGQAREMRYVLERLDQLVLKPAFGSATPGQSPPPGRRKMGEYRRDVTRAIQSSPREFVGQERVKLSQAPIWADGGLAARSVIVRAYVACGVDDAFAVMPGGLTRVSKNPNDLPLSMQSGSDSKDTWVLSKDAPGLSERPHLPSESAGESMPSGVPSRVADHLFWLGRYTERLEQLLRTLRSMLARLSGEVANEADEVTGLMRFAANLGLFPSSASSTVNGELPKRMLQLLYDPDEAGAVRDLLQRIRYIAAAVRDRFSGDTWRILGRLDSDARLRPGRLPLASATALSHNLVLDLAAFNGMEMENMTRGRGWRFLDFGRRLERGIGVIKLIKAAAAAGPASRILELVLEIADSSMTYRRQFFSAPQLAGVLALVLGDESNPRALVFQINLLAEHADALKLDPNAAALGPGQDRILGLLDQIRATDLNRMAAWHARGTEDALLDLLNDWSAELAALSDEVTGRYFSHSIPRVS